MKPIEIKHFLSPLKIIKNKQNRKAENETESAN